MKTEKNNLFSVRSMVITALFTALICVAAPFSIYAGPVPISLGTFAVYLAGALLGAKRGAVAVTVYILIGTIGLPVFTGFTGGFAKLLGATGGYLIGYIPLALITGLFSDAQPKRPWKAAIGMVLGTVVLYAFGTVWFMILTGSLLGPALAACVVPFLAGDAIKMVCVTALCAALKPRLDKMLRDTEN